MNDTYFCYNGVMACKREEYIAPIKERGRDYILFMRPSGEFCRYSTDKPIFPFACDEVIQERYECLSKDEGRVFAVDCIKHSNLREDERLFVAKMSREVKALKEYLEQLEYDGVEVEKF